MPDDKRHGIAKHGEEENEIEPAAADDPGSSDEVAIDALLKAMPPEVRQAINSMPPELRGRLTSFTVSASIRSPFLPPNLLEAYENVVPGSARERTKQVIHYIIEHTCPDLGATKLCKVMWRADLHHYRRHGETISGQDSYVRTPRGPVPNGFHDALRSLEKHNAIQKKPVTVFNFTRHEFHVLKRTNKNWFPESAQQALQEAIDAITPAAIIPAKARPDDISRARQEQTVPAEA